MMDIGKGLNVSIAMATYNGARYILEQLNSLSSQTLLPFELVVTDDGSTDATLEIVAKFAANAPFPVSIHRNETRLGFAANFLHAVSLCKGELIAFCDQDDIWEESKLAHCVALFDTSEVLMCVHSADLIDAEGKLLGRQFPKFNNYYYRANSKAPEFFYYGFSLVFRRLVFELVSKSTHLYDLGHDTYIGFLCASLGDVVFLSDTLARYRQHGSNACGAPDYADGVSVIIAESRRIGANNYADRSYIAKQKADFLTVLSSSLEGIFKQNSLVGAARENRSYAAFSRRKERYEARSSFAVLRGIMKATILGDYGRKSKGGLGGRAIIKDFLQVVAPGFLEPVQSRRVSDEK